MRNDYASLRTASETMAIRATRVGSVLLTSVSANRLTKVPSRELATRAGLQIAFELERGPFVVELDDDEPSP
jgi:hypothetical protein